MSFKEYVIERDAVNTYGKESQLIVAIEELAELQKELTKYLRGKGNIDHIYEEMADVHIMLDQLHIIFKDSAAFKMWKQKKLQRLVERLHNSSNDE